MDDYFAEGSTHSPKHKNYQDEFPENSESRTEKFVIRFPYGMRHEVHKAANRNNRSMNRELVARVGHSLAHFPSVPGARTEKLHEAEAAKTEDIMKYQSPESEILLDHRLRQKMKQLNFEQKKAMLTVIEAFAS